MRMTMRWFGASDRIPLAHIRQVPVVSGVVSALYDIPVGDVWPTERIAALKQEIERHDLQLDVIESIPVHDDIKLGRPSRDHYIAQYALSIRNLASCGVPVLCYNFMPVFDWTRTNLAHRLPDGSTTLTFAQSELDQIDLALGTAGLPGWGETYTVGQLSELMSAYRALSAEALFENLVYFLERVTPVAEEVGVKLAIHPDDPPWPIFGLPRIVSTASQLQRLLDAVPINANGLTFCTGSLGADPQNDLPAMARQFASRIHFVHARNVRNLGNQHFQEVPHPSDCGNIRLSESLLELHHQGFDGPVRPDHGRMIWNETGRPGYGLYDRALGAMYLHGLLEGAARVKEAKRDLSGQ